MYSRTICASATSEAQVPQRFVTNTRVRTSLQSTKPEQAVKQLDAEAHLAEEG